MNNITYKINDLSDVPAAIEISKEIFHPSAEEIREYHDGDDWIHKINVGGLLVVAYVEEKPAALAMCYLKDQNTLHITIGGVLERYRGLGLWSAIFKKVEAYTKEHNHLRLTLNTYREKFPVMYAFAFTHGFTCYKTEMRHGFEKSYFERCGHSDF